MSTAEEVTLVPPDPNSPTNKALGRVERALADSEITPDLELGVLIMACVLAARRMLNRDRVTDRGRRMKLIRRLVGLLDARLRQYLKAPGT